MRSARSVAALPHVSAAEAAWVRALALPLEIEPALEPGTLAREGASGGSGGGEPEEDQAARLECPLTLWPRFKAAFGAGVAHRAARTPTVAASNAHGCSLQRQRLFCDRSATSCAR